jgi:hypothetical protein
MLLPFNQFRCGAAEASGEYTNEHESFEPWTVARWRDEVMAAIAAARSDA